MRVWIFGLWLGVLSTPYAALSTQYVRGQGPSSKAAPAITALAVTPDGAGYLQGSQAGVLYHSQTTARSERVATQLDHVHAAAFSPDGKTLALAGGTPAEAGAVELWSWPNRKLLATLREHDDLVYDVVWLPSGKALVTASADRTVRTWDLATRQCAFTLKGHSGPVLSLAVSPEGSLLCSGSADQTIRVWDAATGKLLRSLNNHLGPVHGLAFRPGKKEGPATLASAGGDSTVRIWQPALGRMVRILRHPAPVHTLVWDHDGTHLWSGAKDGRVRQLDADSAAVLGEYDLSRGALVSLASGPGSVLAGDTLGRVSPVGPRH